VTAVRHRCTLAVFVAGSIAALGGCTADTEDLRGRHDAGIATDGADGGDAGRDATIGEDAHDAGFECTHASECTNLGVPPCEDQTSCRCGCYGYCTDRRCGIICDDSCVVDAGIAPDSGIPPEPQECTTPATCPSGQLPRVCNNQGGPSCAFGACVLDCAESRLCQYSGNDCVECVYTSTSALTNGCPTCIMVPIDEATVEDATCELGLDPNDVIRFTSQADCSWSVDFAGTGSASDRLVSLDDGQFVGTLSRFGSPCLVSFAATNALRTIWACPGCTFVLFHH